MAEDEKATDSNVPEGERDGELNAMNLAVAALKPLKEDERRRVLEYILGRFGAVALQPPSLGLTSPGTGPLGLHTPAAGNIHDIRTLKETKAPKSANEMAALVAYYISELAPPGERRSSIGKSDIERYFKSGTFKLTAKAGQTLVNAKNAGYLDPGPEPGQYKLNPVGYNLVVHRLGSAGEGPKKRRRHRKGKKRTRRSSR